LESCNTFAWRMVLREFTGRSANLDPAIRQMVQEQIVLHGPRYSEVMA
jgi:hypothetical protein